MCYTLSSLSYSPFTLNLLFLVFFSQFLSTLHRLPISHFHSSSTINHLTFHFLSNLHSLTFFLLLTLFLIFTLSLSFYSSLSHSLSNIIWYSFPTDLEDLFGTRMLHFLSTDPGKKMMIRKTRIY